MFKVQYTFIIALRIACGIVAGDIIQDLYPRLYTDMGGPIHKYYETTEAELGFTGIFGVQIKQKSYN